MIATVSEIAAGMTGVLTEVSPGRHDALLPSPSVQNHASFLCELPNGTLACLWFGGSLEGKSDIAIRAALLPPGADRWSSVTTLSNDPNHSEQNPVLFPAPDGRLLLFHTSQPAGNQDECRIRMVEVTHENGALHAGVGQFLDLPHGSFVRAPIQVLQDGAWLLPLFRCVSRPGQKWTGSHDVAAFAVSRDAGMHWDYQEIPGSLGCVHTTVLPTQGGFAAFFRRRQADFVYRADGAADALAWQAPCATDVPNNNSSMGVIRLATGEVAMICNPVNGTMSNSRRASLYDELGEEDDRPHADSSGGCRPIWGVERAPVILALSKDDGRSFPTRFMIEDGPGHCLSNNSLDGKNCEMSYPWIVEAQDGALHLSYSYHRRGIKHVRLTPGWRGRLETYANQA